MPPRSDAYEVLIIRAWAEEHGEAPLRVVLTRTATTGDDAPAPIAVASVDDACDAVRAWLLGLMASPGR